MSKALPLIVSLLLCAVPARAADLAPVQNSGEKAHPELLRLEKELTDKQTEKKDGRLLPEQYQEWEREFRSNLEESFGRAPRSALNTAAHARITAQLGDRKQAGQALDRALEADPDSPVLLRTKSQLSYEQKDYPAAAQYGLEAWEKSGRTDQSALALYNLSKGRGAPSGTTTSAPPTSGPAATAPVAAPADAPQPVERSITQPTVSVPLPGQDTPAQENGKSPRWPLTVPFAGGLIAYGLYRAKQNEGTAVTPANEPAQAFVTPEVAAAAAGPAAEVAKKVIGEALKKGAQAAAASATAAVVITSLTYGAIVSAGVATIVGLDRMIEAQDKYNDALAQLIRPAASQHGKSTRKQANRNDPSTPPELGPATAVDPYPIGKKTKRDKCALLPGEDILSRFVDNTRLAPGFLPKHEGHNQGHTIEKHVAKSLSYLVRRTKTGARDASSFHDMRIAEETIKQTVIDHRAGIQEWYLGPLSDEDAFDADYTGNYQRSIGYSVSEQDAETTLPKYDALTVLRKNAKCEIFILTAYPR